MTEAFLQPDEFIVDLKQGLKLIQRRRGYGLTTDAVLLANFVRLTPGDRVAELGAGNGVILLLLSLRVEGLIVWGLELQARLVDQAQRSVRMNRLPARIKVEHGDLRQIQAYQPSNTFEVVISNPPFWPVGTRRANFCPEVAWAKEEHGCTLAEVITAGHWLLRPGGRMALIHLWQRREEVIETFLQKGMEPRVCRGIKDHPKALPTRILIEAVKIGTPPVLKAADQVILGHKCNPGSFPLQTIMQKIKQAPLILHTEKGEFTPEVRVMYDA